MADQFCKWSAEVLDVAAVPTMVRRAVRTALTPPTGPVFLALPLDVMLAETDATPERLGRIPTAGRGDAAMLAAATDALVAADNPVLVVGDGVARADAVEEAVAFAAATGARVHVSDDAWQVGKNQPADVGIVGDPGDVLAELAWRVGDRLDADARDARLERAASTTAFVAAKVAEMGEGADGDDPWASKADLVDAIRAAAPDAYVVDEGVTAKYAMLTRWPLGARQYLSNKGGGLGYGLPAALGAAIAEAETDDPRSVLGVVGDGSYLYYPHALYTAARYGLDLTVVIPDNRNYRILKENAAELFEDLDLADFEAIDGEGGKGTDDGDGTDVLDVLVHD
jgi:benzoylformate decarboxylase